MMRSVWSAAVFAHSVSFSLSTRSGVLVFVLVLVLTRFCFILHRQSVVSFCVLHSVAHPSHSFLRSAACILLCSFCLRIAFVTQLVGALRSMFASYVNEVRSVSIA